ncbi:MAG: hypothetical protein DI607_09570 [Sphingomonas hengshuiensis]|nr:MAG: hypothetical protein DI607_09570 [Sphingomonas hengshuiensis]
MGGKTGTAPAMMLEGLGWTMRRPN